MDDRGPGPELNVGSTRAARLLRRGMILLLGALALSVAAPAMASATTPGWELNELPLTESTATAWSGNIKETDSDLPIIGSETLECEATAEGTAGVLNVGKVTAWKSTKCVTVGGCEKSVAAKEVKIIPLHLPWNTELVTVEGQVREVAVSGGSGTPGFEMVCWVLGGPTNDECLGTINLTTKNVTGGVSATFDAAEKLKCSVLGTNSGSLEGTQSIKSSAGTLHTAEGLASGWIDNGAPITEKKTSTLYGTIKLYDQLHSLGTVEVACEDTGKGNVGAGINGEVTSLTASNCSSQRGCEANTATIEAVNLPWHTELATIEGGLNETFKTAKNGFKLKCKDSGTNVTDTCSVVPNAKVTNKERNINMAFKSEKFTCEGLSGTGELQGTQTVELSLGGDLWAA